MANPALETKRNPFRLLQDNGQQVWYQGLRRSLLKSGQLAELIDADGLAGVLFDCDLMEKVIAGSTDYDEAIDRLCAEQKEPPDIFEHLLLEDVRNCADTLRGAYDSTSGQQGYVTLPVSPYLMDSAEEMISEAERLFTSVGRKNVLVSVPATESGIATLEHLLSKGIGTHLGPVYSLEFYRQVGEAYVAGMEKFARRGGQLSSLSGFVSVSLAELDASVQAAIAGSERADILRELMGTAALANATIVYWAYREIFGSAQWKALSAKGARPQRLLWIDTLPSLAPLKDTHYIDRALCPETAICLKECTWWEYREHGQVSSRLDESLDESLAVLDRLKANGIDLQAVCNSLQYAAGDNRCEQLDYLLAAIDEKAGPWSAKAAFSCALGQYQAQLSEQLADEKRIHLLPRLWRKDASLWTQCGEENWLGWLNIVDRQRGELPLLQKLEEEIITSGFKHALLLGMGGSSLSPEVLQATFGNTEDHLQLFVLDSTVPSQINAVKEALDLSNTLCIVASKSGSTIEPNVLCQYFFDCVKRVVGAEAAGQHFIAITDPGSSLERVAQELKFRSVMYGISSIGGRYSALSNFGMVPGCLIGLDLKTFLARAERMTQNCSACVSPADSTAVVLGTILAVCALNGRDKVTIAATPALADLGAWLEQLLAESTGKLGKGLIPIDAEALGPPAVYSADRLFVHLRLATELSDRQDSQIAELEKSGHPVVRIVLDDSYDLGAEFFRWEVATAVAGHLLQINAFDQPNVQESKDFTKRFLKEYKEKGALPEDVLLFEGQGVKLYTDAANKQHLEAEASNKSLAGFVAAHLQRLGAGDYFAINAYVERNTTTWSKLKTIRHHVRDNRKVATTVGYGPRFLHSTGQLHKGGPNSGVFLQITADDQQDIAIPGETFTFGILKQAQALGDFLALSNRQRRLLRVHLGKDVNAGLDQLTELILSIS